MRLAIIDVETTGLHQEARLLEIAVLLYETESKEVEVGTGFFVNGVQDLKKVTLPAGLESVFHRVFWQDERTSWWQPEALEMHQKNGLLEECRRSNLLPDEVDLFLSAWLPEKVIPCGRNVHFDVDVMRRHLPLSAGRLHYRHLDLTTLDLASPLGKAPRPPSTHRALHDAMAELLELKNRGIA